MTDGTDEDVGGNMSSDDAAWRELVAQYELPAVSDPADSPWPERENLGSSRDSSPQVTGPQVTGQPAADHAAPDAAELSGPDAPGSGTAPSNDAPGNDAPGNDAPDAGTPVAGTPAAEAPDAGTPGAGTPGTEDPGSDADGDDRRARGAGSDRTRVVRPASPVWRPATDAAEEDDDQYIPPPPPPLPSLDPVAKGAWAALFGGPVYLLLATFLGWQVSGLAALLAVTAFVGGFAVVVFRMGDGPSRGDGPDNGAVV
jgi:hypothetical protein